MENLPYNNRFDPPSVFDWIKSQVCFPLFHQHRKIVRANSEIRNIIPDELHLLKHKDRIEDINNIQHKLKPVGISNISVIRYRCNEKLIIQSTDFLVQSTTSKFSLQINSLSFESFHCGTKC